MTTGTHATFGRPPARAGHLPVRAAPPPAGVGRPPFRAAVVLGAALLLAGSAGCATEAGTAGSAATASPDTTTTTTSPALPSPSPTAARTRVTGSVTRGGSGPCYGLRADDGTLYALYNPRGVRLTLGERLTVGVEPLRLRIDCGPGTTVAVVTLDRLG